MVHVFISYAKADTRALAIELRNELLALDEFTVWMDDSLESAESWAAQIQEELDRADYVVVLLSTDVNRPVTATQRRSFVLNEIDYAQQLNKPIIPILVDETLIPVQLAGIQYIDFTYNREVGLSRLINDLKRRVGIQTGDTTMTSPPIPHYRQQQATQRARPSRAPLVAGALVVLLIIAVGGLALFSSGLLSPGATNTPTPLPNLETRAALRATALVITPSLDPDLVIETRVAQIIMDNTQQASTAVAAREATALATQATATPNLTETQNANLTQAAIDATEAAEETVQARQLAENEATNTRQPTVTPTATNTPTQTPVPTNTTEPIDVGATETAGAIQATEIYQAALATQTIVATEATEVISIGRINADNNVNVRTGPGRGFSVVGLVGDGEEVIVLSDDPGGLWKEIETASGVRGWVASLLVEDLGNPTPVPTVAPTISLDIALERARAGVNTNDDWQIVERDFEGVAMVLVPTGCFVLGNEQIGGNEIPTTELCIEEPFWIDQTEVTNRQFEQLGGEAGRDSRFDSPNRPRDQIRWGEAQAFCELRGGRLPSEAEWEYAARGPDNLSRPWGNFLLEDGAAYLDTITELEEDGTVPVGTFPSGESWVGALDMVGNVWEWTLSINQPYPYNPDDGREDLTANAPRVIRGGAYDRSYSEMRTTNRDRYAQATNLPQVGFRCLLEIES